MAKLNKLNPGDRVAYAAKFLKNTGQFTGSGPQRRGTFVSYDKASPDFARVKWDDFEANAAYYDVQYGDDYTADARQYGQMVHAGNIAKVGSPRFASNDL
jgi:hypothetical protein